MDFGKISSTFRWTTSLRSYWKDLVEMWLKRSRTVEMILNISRRDLPEKISFSSRSSRKYVVGILLGRARRHVIGTMSSTCYRNDLVEILLEDLVEILSERSRRDLGTYINASLGVRTLSLSLRPAVAIKTAWNFAARGEGITARVLPALSKKSKG